MTELLVLFATFVILVFGAGPALVPVKLGSPLHRVTVGIVASLVALYLFGFALYVLNLPPALQWLAPAGVLILTWQRWRVVAELWNDREVRQAALAWLAVAAWVLGWQLTIFSYSGATWRGDWYEHFHRTRFFIEHWDVHYHFLGANSLAARPPLVNIVTADFLSLAGSKFHVYQATCALLGSLVVWPVCLLQRQFAGIGRTVRFGWAALLLMALPAMVQNATFTWTKLPAAFLVLSGIALLAVREANFPARLAGLLSLTAALLAHYSAGPWIVAIVAAELVRAGWRPFFTRPYLKIGVACFLLFATWLGWSVWRLGWQETIGSNTTVADSAKVTVGQRLGGIAENLYYSAVPVLFRHVDYGPFTARDAVVRVRDQYFNAVQSSIPMIAGSLGLVVAAGLLWTGRKKLDRQNVAYWSTLLGVAVVLGIAVHTEVVKFGVAHICLVSFALLVVAWLAARVPDATRLWQIVLAVGVATDLALGIALHFAVQSLLLPMSLHPGPAAEISASMGAAAWMNFQARQIVIEEPFLSDLPAAALLSLLLLFAAGVLLRQCFRATASNLPETSSTS